MSGDVFRIVMRRIMPVLFLSYVVSFLDRVNIGFAKLQMSAELGYSDVVYGFGARAVRRACVDRADHD